ncbi:probable transmembrane GTPase FZO-like, chloroplastic isoform X2 [Ananas comosus]|uniref:Probable transmembrane GTPase FZO-like, chloroplastic isoform X2 n=1 Tax=Ananas comosus TaxID=4615 RepID=A0A6P5ES27_ANACO|nr:probable transmembrane GTPase FZO-like, chloroplastic isoform X2 [Ananas comosus]
MVVSFPHNCSTAPRLPHLPLFITPHHPLSRAHPRPRPRPRPYSPRSLAPIVAASSSSPNPPEWLRTPFPGGFKRPEITVPTLVLRVGVEEVLLGEESAAAINVAVSRGGAGIVVLDGGVGSAGGGRVYEAARVLRSLIGDRAYLLVAERVDVASASGADGIVLSDDGIPAIVARKMMMNSKPDSIYLPLVARVVQTTDAATNASASEGADFLIISTNIHNFSRILENFVTRDIRVPIFFNIVDLVEDESPSDVTSMLLQSGACGVVVSLADMKLLGDDPLVKVFSKVHVSDRILRGGRSFSKKLDVDDIRVVSNGKKGITGFTKLEEKEMQLIETERLLLSEAVAVIKKAAPMMKEVSLLVDAASRLTEPFLLVIVGEFNSGKSTVINALLGRSYLKEGVVPTTNEITLLSYSEVDSNQQERCERHPDGQFICYISAPILKEMNLVDTPGTNVILQRQQRLTEEFVPRADLILFVLSSDRPLTESEVAFLLYVQQWKKKVVFVLNKMDLYRNDSELEEAIEFVKENTKKLLNAEDVRLFPVSARFALEAKLSSIHDGISHEHVQLDDPRWTSSRFYELEKFLFSFLDASTDAGKERVLLKLETPIRIADRLLTSCESFIKQEYENASQDLVSINNIISCAKEYAAKMETESNSWRKQILSLKLLSEYSSWLESSYVCEANFYAELFNKRWNTPVDVKDKAQPDTCVLVSKGGELSTKVLEGFSASAAARVFEQEIREVVVGTFGGLGAAGLSASLLTSVLPTTVEDLLALAFCSAGGLLAISNFPSRRKDAVEKVAKLANSLASEVENAMKRDLLNSSEKLSQFVEVSSKPYRDAAEKRIDRLQEIQGELSSIQQKLQALKVEIQNLLVL